MSLISYIRLWLSLKKRELEICYGIQNSCSCWALNVDINEYIPPQFVSQYALLQFVRWIMDTTKDDPPAYTAAQDHHQNLGYDQETNNGPDLASPYPTDFQQFPHMSYLSIDPVYFTQQQPQQVQPQPSSNQARLYRSLNFATILSCAVFWWCGAIFGFIAFMFASKTSFFFCFRLGCQHHNTSWKHKTFTVASELNSLSTKKARIVFLSL